MAKPLPPPPTPVQTATNPTPVDRKPQGKGKDKGDQINFRVRPEVKKDIQMLCVELGMSQQDYLEKIHYFYKQHHKGK